MTSDFEQLVKNVADIKNHKENALHEDFFREEVLRFISIAGTIKASFPDISNNTDARIISHILIRSLIENYFRLLYIFDDDLHVSTRFNECLNDFKKNYLKLHNDNFLPNKDQLELPDYSWSSLPNQKDLNSMLTALRNDYGDRLSFLYFIYRISSFDTHGNGLNSFFNATFGKTCNFPYLKLDFAIDLIANQYLFIWSEIKSTSATKKPEA